MKGTFLDHKKVYTCTIHRSSFFENNQIITVIIILAQKMTMNKDLTLLA